MKDIAKIFAYLVAVILLGALLAPPLYWGAHWLAGLGIFPALAEFPFQKFFNRAALVAAVVLLWPAIKWLRVGNWRELGLERDPRWRQHLFMGFVIAGLAVAALGFAYVQLDIYDIRKEIRWSRLPNIVLTAVVIGFLEEALFRGAILGLVRRSLRPYAALFWVSALFSIVHFLKPDKSVAVPHVGWLSGFELMPHAFHQFAEPSALLAGFTTLFVLGWLCGDATLRTRALWMSIGLHAGVVFVKESFLVFARLPRKHSGGFPPWVGPEFQAGLAPVGMLLVAWVAVVLWLKYENRARAAAAR